MRSSSHPGLGGRSVDRAQAQDPERHRGHRPKALHIVGIGPGDLTHLSGRAAEVLAAVDTVAGYTTYIHLIADLVAAKTIISTGMTREVDRVDAALAAAMAGQSTAIVSSGDPGIYAMAGLVLEMCRGRDIAIAPMRQLAMAPAGDPRLFIEVVPGIPALASGAALLGAPLTHDFAAISLSDLLTPWEVIEKRLAAAAAADFVIVLYNPKSRRRSDHLARAAGIIMAHRSPETPVGIVTAAMREGQRVTITTLGRLAEAAVDMQTTVFIGSGASVRYLDFMITPRGYGDKYRLT